MGWTSSYSWETKQDVIDEVTSQSHWGDQFELMRHSVVGNHVWCLMRYADHHALAGGRFIALFMLAKADDCWAYKDLDESCGPFAYDCPITLIREAEKDSVPMTGHTQEWRQKVKDFHQAQTEKRRQIQSQAVPNAQVKLYGEHYTLIEKYPGQRGWKVHHQNGGIYRMSHQQIRQAEFITN